MVSHMSTDWWDYVQDVIGDDSYTDAANRAGFDKSAFSRWRKGAKADPAFAVALARGYGANVLEALVAAGLITSREAGLTVVHAGADDAIRQASGRMLADELARRLSSAETSGGPSVCRRSGTRRAARGGGAGGRVSRE